MNNIIEMILLKIGFVLIVIAAIFIFNIMLDGIAEKDRPRVICCGIALVFIMAGFIE